LRVEPLAVIEQIEGRVLGIDIEIGGELADLQRQFTQDHMLAVLARDFVSEVDGDGGRAAAARHARDGDHLILRRRLSELLSDALHRGPKVLGLDWQRDNLRGAGAHRPEQNGRVSHRINKGEDRLPDEYADQLPQFGKRIRVGNRDDE
jgi:hypothetical protein